MICENKKSQSINPYILQEQNGFLLAFNINIIKEELNTEAKPKKYTRGKFELWFFKEFYNQFNKKLISEYSINIKNKGLDKKKMKSDSDISNNEKAIERFVSKLTIPEDLKEFLLNNYNKLN